jgi:hypothetical protein
MRAVRVFLSVQPRPAQPQLQFLDQLQDFAGRARFQDIGDQRSGEGLNEAGDIRWIRHDFLVSKRTAVCTLSRWQQPGTRRRYSRTVRASPEGIYLAPCLVSNIAHLSTLFCRICAQSRGERRRTTTRGRTEAKIGRSVRGFFRAASFSFGKLDLIARMFELGHSRHRYPISASGCRRASYTS